MAIKASFIPGTACCSDRRQPRQHHHRPAATRLGNILINGGAISIDGGQPTVANTTEIEVFGGNGNDTISLDNGALPPHSCSAATATTC